MNPLLTLVAGAAVGVLSVRMAKSANAQKALRTTAARGRETVRTGLDQARRGGRDAAVSGLKAVENTSATLRRKLDDTLAEELPESTNLEGAAKPGEADDGREGA